MKYIKPELKKGPTVAYSNEQKSANCSGGSSHITVSIDKPQVK